jgi:hypothetical protein
MSGLLVGALSRRRKRADSAKEPRYSRSVERYPEQIKGHVHGRVKLMTT